MDRDIHTHKKLKERDKEDELNPIPDPHSDPSVRKNLIKGCENKTIIDDDENELRKLFTLFLHLQKVRPATKKDGGKKSISPSISIPPETWTLLPLLDSLQTHLKERSDSKKNMEEEKKDEEGIMIDFKEIVNLSEEQICSEEKEKDEDSEGVEMGSKNFSKEQGEYNNDHDNISGKGTSQESLRDVLISAQKYIPSPAPADDVQKINYSVFVNSLQDVNTLANFL